MSLIPGKIVQTVQTKDGRSVIIRYPEWEDIPLITEYINTISKEDTYITFSGEQQSIADEAVYIGSAFARMETGDGVYLVCEADGKIVGISQVDRILSKRERSKHVGSFGISLAADMRGQGIGFVFAQTVIEEAKQHIQGLRLIILDCFEENTRALTLYKKLGFVQTGLVPGAMLYKGKYMGEVQMALMLV